MFTVNLERQLIKQNKKLLLPDELLRLREYERVGDDFCENNILTRVGMNHAAIKGRSIKNKTIEQNKKIALYDKERVFHITQIKSLCKKYHLRFLNVEYFIGSADKELASKISTFEIANNIELLKDNCNIAAPASSFYLEKKPKDPLFFYKITNDGYWYLIHKWGNDLSFFRRFYGILSTRIAAFLIFYILPLFIMWGLAINFKNAVIGAVATICSVVALVLIIADFIEEERPRLVKPNQWDSEYL